MTLPSSEAELTYRMYHTDTVHWPAFLGGRVCACRFTDRHRSTASKLVPGDRFVAYLKERKSFCGILEVTGPSLWSDADPDYPVQVPVRPVLLRDANDAVLVTDDEVWRVLTYGRDIKHGSQSWPAKVGTRGDMWPLKPGVGDGLLRLLQRHGPDALSDIDSAELQDVRLYMMRSIKARSGQDAFRRALLEAYNGRCAISGCAVLEVLEAAHIIPHQGIASQVPSNGLLLRADLHALFDCGLITVEPVNRVVVIAARLAGSAYTEYDGRPLAGVSLPEARPSGEALRLHFAAARAGIAAAMTSKRLKP